MVLLGGSNFSAWSREHAGREGNMEICGADSAVAPVFQVWSKEHRYNAVASDR